MVSYKNTGENCLITIAGVSTLVERDQIVELTSDDEQLLYNNPSFIKEETTTRRSRR